MSVWRAKTPPTRGGGGGPRPGGAGAGPPPGGPPPPPPPGAPRPAGLGAAPPPDDEVVEAVEKWAQLRWAHGQVEGEGPARQRERQGPGIGRAEALEHGEERRRARPAQALEGRPQGVLGAERHRHLVLEEATRAVEA